MLEIIAEREVAEHFKISAVPRSMTHVFDIGGSNALLAGRYAVTRRLFNALKVFLERRHARVYQQNRVVVRGRHKREAGQSEVPLALKKAK